MGGSFPHFHFWLLRSGFCIGVARNAISTLLPHLIIHPTPHEISLEKGERDLLPFVWLVSHVYQRCDKWLGYNQLVTIVDQQPPPRAALLALLLHDAETVPPLFELVGQSQRHGGAGQG